MADLGKIFGIGPGHEAALAEAGIETLAELAACDDTAALADATGISRGLIEQWRGDAAAAMRMSRARNAAMAVFAVIAIAAIATIFFTLQADRSELAEQVFQEAAVLYDAGEYEEAARLLDEAIADGVTSSNVYNLRGMVFHAEGNLPEAEKRYDLAIYANRFNAYANNNLANLLSATSRPDEALRHYRRALELQPDEPLFHENLAIHLENRGQFTDSAQSYLRAAELGDEPQLLADAASRFKSASAYTAAFALYERLAAREPDNWNWQFQAGWTALQSADIPTATARQLLTAVLENFPGDEQNKWVYLNLAISRSNEDLAEAQRLIGQALDIDPEFIAALQQSAYFQSAAGDYEAAIGILEQIIALDPEYSSAYQDLHSIYAYQLVDHDKAAAALERLEQVADDDNYNLLLLQYDRISAEGDYAEQRSHLEHMLEIYPDDPWIIIKFCELMFMRGRDAGDPALVTEAFELLEETMQSNPNRAPYMSHLNFTKAWGHHVVPQVKDLEIAEEYYLKTIAGDANWLTPKSNLMALYLETGEYEKGLAQGDAALAINRRNVSLLTNLGLLAFVVDDLDEALGYFDEAIEVTANEPVAYAGRAVVQTWRGDLPAAREDIAAARRTLAGSGVAEVGTSWEFVIREEHNPRGEHHVVHLYDMPQKEAFLDVLAATAFVRAGRAEAAIAEYRRARERVAGNDAASRELALFALSQFRRHLQETAGGNAPESIAGLLDDWYGDGPG